MGNQHIAGIIMRQLMIEKHGDILVSVFREMMPGFLAENFPGEPNGGGTFV